MNKQLKKLTWKYFGEQKKEEITNTIKIIIIVILSIIGLVFINNNIIYPITNGLLCYYEEAFPKFFTGNNCNNLGSGVIGWLVILLIFCLIIITKDWILSNWEKAKERAREELRK